MKVWLLLFAAVVNAVKTIPQCRSDLNLVRLTDYDFSSPAFKVGGGRWTLANTNAAGALGNFTVPGNNQPVTDRYTLVADVDRNNASMIYYEFAGKCLLLNNQINSTSITFQSLSDAKRNCSANFNCAGFYSNANISNYTMITKPFDPASQPYSRWDNIKGGDNSSASTCYRKRLRLMADGSEYLLTSQVFKTPELDSPILIEQWVEGVSDIFHGNRVAEEDGLQIPITEMANLILGFSGNKSACNLNNDTDISFQIPPFQTQFCGTSRKFQHGVVWQYSRVWRAETSKRYYPESSSTTLSKISVISANSSKAKIIDFLYPEVGNGRSFPLTPDFTAGVTRPNKRVPILFAHYFSGTELTSYVCSTSYTRRYLCEASSNMTVQKADLYNTIIGMDMFRTVNGFAAQTKYDFVMPLHQFVVNSVSVSSNRSALDIVNAIYECGIDSYPAIVPVFKRTIFANKNGTIRLCPDFDDSSTCFDRRTSPVKEGGFTELTGQLATIQITSLPKLGKLYDKVKGVLITNIPYNLTRTYSFVQQPQQDGYVTDSCGGEKLMGSTFDNETACFTKISSDSNCSQTYFTYQTSDKSCWCSSVGDCDTVYSADSAESTVSTKDPTKRRYKRVGVIEVVFEPKPNEHSWRLEKGKCFKNDMCSPRFPPTTRNETFMYDDFNYTVIGYSGLPAKHATVSVEVTPSKIGPKYVEAKYDIYPNTDKTNNMIVLQAQAQVFLTAAGEFVPTTCGIDYITIHSLPQEGTLYSCDQWVPNSNTACVLFKNVTASMLPLRINLTVSANYIEDERIGSTNNYWQAKLFYYFSDTYYGLCEESQTCKCPVGQTMYIGQKYADGSNTGNRNNSFEQLISFPFSSVNSTNANMNFICNEETLGKVKGVAVGSSGTRLCYCRSQDLPVFSFNWTATDSCGSVFDPSKLLNTANNYVNDTLRLPTTTSGFFDTASSTSPMFTEQIKFTPALTSRPKDTPQIVKQDTGGDINLYCADKAIPSNNCYEYDWVIETLPDRGKLCQNTLDPGSDDCFEKANLPIKLSFNNSNSFNVVNNNQSYRLVYRPGEALPNFGYNFSSFRFRLERPASKGDFSVTKSSVVQIDVSDVNDSPVLVFPAKFIVYENENDQKDTDKKKFDELSIPTWIVWANLSDTKALPANWAGVFSQGYTNNLSISITDVDTTWTDEKYKVVLSSSAAAMSFSIMENITIPPKIEYYSTSQNRSGKVTITGTLFQVNEALKVVGVYCSGPDARNTASVTVTDSGTKSDNTQKVVTKNFYFACARKADQDSSDDGVTTGDKILWGTVGGLGLGCIFLGVSRIWMLQKKKAKTKAANSQAFMNIEL